jgi:hypothetical protein
MSWFLSQLRHQTHGGGAALRLDEGLPPLPIRQWVLRVSCPSRLLLAREPKVMGKVVGSHCCQSLDQAR